MSALLPILLLACTTEPVELDGAPIVDTENPGACGDAPCVAPTLEDAYVAFHRLVIDEQGVAWVSWVEAHGASHRTLYVGRSVAPGAPIDAIVEVPSPDHPITGGSEKPGLAVAGDRIAVGYTGVGSRRHGDAQAVYVQLGTIGADGLVEFDDARLVETSDGGRWVLEQAQVAMSPDAEPWLFYKRQDYGVRDVATWAREATDFAPEVVSEALSTQHDCSPPELQVTSAGEPVAALRSNMGGLLQTVIVTPDGPVQVTDSQWAYNDAVCPEDGPRLARLDYEAWVVVWIEPVEDGSLWRSWISSSPDAGMTWSAPVPAHESDVGLGERKPAITAAGGGYVLSVEALDRTTRIWDRRGVAGEVRPLEAPGAVPLEQVELASGGGRTAALGLGDDGLLWLVEVP